MKQTYYLTLAIIGAMFIAAFFMLDPLFDAHAQETDGAAVAEESRITFPIEELGNCSDKVSCREYCSLEEHKEACTAFAEAHNLIPTRLIKEIKERREELKIKLEGTPGPGGCTSIQECRENCSNEASRTECLEFGLNNGLLPPQAALQAKRIITLKTVGGPGGCSTPGECREFCSLAENKEACVAFAEEHDLISNEERARFEERRAAFEERISETGGPGGCADPEECRLYCQDPEHTEQCLSF